MSCRLLLVDLCMTYLGIQYRRGMGLGGSACVGDIDIYIYMCVCSVMYVFSVVKAFVVFVFCTATHSFM